MLAGAGVGATVDAAAVRKTPPCEGDVDDVAVIGPAIDVTAAGREAVSAAVTGMATVVVGGGLVMQIARLPLPNAPAACAGSRSFQNTAPRFSQKKQPVGSARRLLTLTALLESDNAASAC